ncbi:MAG: phosphate/phosphite/phosphonate ABC transporter substrate-binding protein [Nitrospirota bacterium]
MKHPLFVILAAVSLLVAAAAIAAPERMPPAGSAASNAPPLVFIILPVENASVVYEKFLPLKDYLEKAVSRRIILRIARDYQEAIREIGAGEAQLAYLDPSAYCEARFLHRVIPLVKAIRNGSPTYRSVIVARSDSGIRKIVEAKKKRVAFGNYSSSSSYLIPAVMFKEVGISLSDFSSVDNLEQEDRIALSVLAKHHDVGGMSERVARKYLGDGLSIINVSEPIPQYTLAASAGLPPALRKSIRSALLSVGQDRDPALIAAMKDIDGFAPVEDREFDVVRVMIKNLTGRNYLFYPKNVIKVAILPLYSAITLFDRFDPLMRYLSKRTGHEFKLVIPKDFEDFFAIIERADADYSYSNPYIYIQLANRGLLTAFANTVLEETGDIFRGIIITHQDSPIQTIADLKGKDVMVVSYRSAGGFLAQKLFLSEHGIDVLRDLRLREGKRQETVILNVYRKTADAGFVRESALDVLREEIDLSRVRVLARTPYIPNWPFAASKRASDELTAQVQHALLELADRKVLAAAGVRGFKKADNRDFDDLRKMIDRKNHE